MSGKLAPDTLKPVPLIPAELIVTAAVPVEVSVRDAVEEEPTFTSPKLRLVALADSFDEVAASPVPLNATEFVGLVDELLVNAIAPDEAPAAVGANLTCSVSTCSGPSVIGKLAPEKLKPAPETLPELIVTGPVPMDTSSSDCVDEDPTVTLPKLRLPTLSESSVVGAASPVPLRLTVAVAFVDEVLLIVSPPEAAPAEAGSNFTCKVTVCFGLSVSGKLAPETLNPAPVTAAEFTVTAAVPVDVRVSDWVDEVPTVTLPKLRLAALSDNCGLGAASPVPLRLNAAVALVEELLLIVSRPLAAPALVGSNCTSSVTLSFGLSVIGKLAPDTLNPAPVIAAELIVTAAVPVDVSVSGCVEEEPTVTSPKLRLAALSDNCGLGAGVPVPLN